LVTAVGISSEGRINPLAGIGCRALKTVS